MLTLVSAEPGQSRYATLSRRHLLQGAAVRLAAPWSLSRAAQIAGAVPDGTQLLLDASSFAVNPNLLPKLPYNSDTAFTPLSMLALYPNVLVCKPNIKAKTVKDLIKMAKAKASQI